MFRVVTVDVTVVFRLTTVDVRIGRERQRGEGRRHRGRGGIVE